MATIQDVARTAHVGVATVSRVINENGYVKAETKDKVLRAIRELNNTPNEMARNLYHKKTGIVAVLIPVVSHPFFSEFMKETEKVLYEEGYQTMICSTFRQQNYEEHYLDLLNKQQVDGIITGVHTLDIKHYQNIMRPIVALDRRLGSHIPCVAVNHEKGGELAAEALIRSGCQKVIQMTGHRSVSSPSNARHEVFEALIKTHGIECINYLTKWNGFEYGDYSSAAEDIAEKYPDIDGVFATDIMACSLIHALAKRGKICPRDYKIVSYDGTFASRIPYPCVTTIEQPIAELASVCVGLLMDQIQGRIIKEMNIQLDVHFRQGQTTAS